MDIIAVLLTVLVIVSFSTTLVLLPDYSKIEKFTRDLSDYVFDYSVQGVYYFRRKKDVGSISSHYISYSFNGIFKGSITLCRGFDMNHMGLNNKFEWTNPYLYYLRKKVEKRIFAVLERSYIEEKK